MKVRIFSKEFIKPFSDLRPQLRFFKLSILRLHFAHKIRLAVIMVRLSLMLIFLASLFFTKQCYSTGLFPIFLRDKIWEWPGNEANWLQ